MTEPAPYPEPEPGTKIRSLPFPVASPRRRRKPLTATRTDGTVIDLRRTLGMAAGDAPDEDDHVQWTPWPPAS